MALGPSPHHTSKYSSHSPDLSLFLPPSVGRDFLDFPFFWRFSTHRRNTFAALCDPRYGSLPKSPCDKFQTLGSMANGSICLFFPFLVFAEHYLPKKLRFCGLGAADIPTKTFISFRRPPFLCSFGNCLWASATKSPFILSQTLPFLLAFAV